MHANNGRANNGRANTKRAFTEVMKEFKIESFMGHRNPYHMLHISKIKRITKLINIIQQRYQTIKYNILSHSPPEQYEDEICLFILSHGSDKKFINKRDGDTELFDNVRIFGLKDTHKNQPAGIDLNYIHDPNHKIRLYHNYPKIITELLSDDTFSYSMSDRELLIESTLKTYYSFFYRDFIDKYSQLESVIRHFINPPIGNFRPIVDHQWSTRSDPIMANASYPSGTFLVLKSTKKEDIPHTCSYNGEITGYRNHLFNPYWKGKLGLETNSSHLVLSELVEKLKSNGYKYVHIIDVSCRFNPHVYHTKTGVSNTIRQLQKHKKNNYSIQVVKGPTRTHAKRLSSPYKILERPIGGSATKELSFKSPIDELKDLLMEDIASTSPLSESHMYQIYKKIIPETKSDQPNRTKALYTWYFMILLGYFTEIYEIKHNAVLAIKGGRSIQLLINGEYKSEDLDIKIVEVFGSKTKKAVAKQLADDLSYGLSNLSILPPEQSKESIYKISLSSDRGYMALVDVDFRELTCEKGEDSIECRLKNILSGVESVPIVINGLDFMEDTMLSYNTYPVSIQLMEKTELINEYKKGLKEDITSYFKDIREQSKDILVDFFYNLKDYDGKSFSGTLMKHMNDFVDKLKDPNVTVSSINIFITEKNSNLFYLHKFKRSYDELYKKIEEDREATYERGKNELEEMKMDIKHKKELLRETSKHMGAAEIDKRKEVIKESEDVASERKLRIKENDEKLKQLHAMVEAAKAKANAIRLHKIAGKMMRTIKIAAKEKLNANAKEKEAKEKHKHEVLKRMRKTIRSGLIRKRAKEIMNEEERIKQARKTAKRERLKQSKIIANKERANAIEQERLRQEQERLIQQQERLRQKKLKEQQYKNSIKTTGSRFSNFPNLPATDSELKKNLNGSRSFVNRVSDSVRKFPDKLRQKFGQGLQ